ncbi:hypothetical protein KR059_005999, partial [Drosophila kikkawai]
QLLALAFAQLSVEEAKKLIDDTSVYSDEETGDDMHHPEPHYPPHYMPHYEPHYHHEHVKTTTTPEPETTTEPALETDNNATAIPDGVGQLDDGLGQLSSGTSLPESTTTPKPETTTTTTTTSTTTTTTTPKPHKHEPHPYSHPHSHPHPHPYPHPYPYPYPYPQQHPHPYGQPELIYPATGPKPASESSSPTHGAGQKSPELSGNPSYPSFRSPYSSYQPPLYQGFPRIPHYGYPEEHNHKEDSAEDKATDHSGEEEEKKPEDDVPLRPPGYGYPSVFLVPRRPVITVPSYPRSGGGYGSSYGYGRY